MGYVPVLKYDPRWPTDHATHDLKLSTRGSRLWCATPMLPRRLSRYSGWQWRYRVLAVTPRVERFRRCPDPILAALGQEKPFLQSSWEERPREAGTRPERHEIGRLGISRSRPFWRV